MELMDDDENNFRRLTANEVLEKYKITDVPVDLEKICEGEKLKINVFDLSGPEKKYNRKISGILIIDDEGRDIFVNEKDNHLRQRFTIAHELGHFFMHRKDDVTKGSLISFRGERTKGETEADQFAAELLMPEKRLMEAYENEIFPTARKLAEIFGVSKAAMMFRLDRLNLVYLNE
jgi:Zn-dependent peptidase ImmA (M78 family)